MVLGLKEGLVKCATVCVKSEVILLYIVEITSDACYFVVDLLMDP